MAIRKFAWPLRNSSHRLPDRQIRWSHEIGQGDTLI